VTLREDFVGPGEQLLLASDKLYQTAVAATAKVKKKNKTLERPLVRAPSFWTQPVLNNMSRAFL